MIKTHSLEKIIQPNKIDRLNLKNAHEKQNSIKMTNLQVHLQKFPQQQKNGDLRFRKFDKIQRF